jgi:hypothetical protein
MFKKESAMKIGLSLQNPSNGMISCVLLTKMHLDPRRYGAKRAYAA